LHRLDGVPIVSRNLELLLGGRLFHAHPETFNQIVAAAFEKEFYVFDGFLVLVPARQAVHAGAEAAMDIVLETGARALAVDRDRAVPDEKVTFDQAKRFSRQ